MVRSWWVNQNERRGGRHNQMVWAPSKGENAKAPHWSWRTLLEVDLGDLIYHYTDQHIVGLSRAAGPAQDFENPYEHDTEWQQQGWRIPVLYEELSQPLHIHDIPENIRKANHSSLGGPFNKNLRPLQGYLLPVQPNLSQAILTLIGFENRDFRSALIQNHGTLDAFETTDRLIQSVARVEQQKLRSILLKGARVAPCGICGFKTEAEYLVAAHIKPRSLCSDQERRDPHVAMLACLLGCDASFENGGLRVLAEGKIFVQEELLKSRPALFSRIHDGIAPAFNKHTMAYFEAKAVSLNG